MTEEHFSDTHVIPSTFPVKASEKPVQKVKPPTMWPCLTCEKQTRSHKFPDGVVLCHGCYERMTDEERAAFQTLHEAKR